jgi:hypothetical protein
MTMVQQHEAGHAEEAVVTFESASGDHVREGAR